MVFHTTFVRRQGGGVTSEGMVDRRLPEYTLVFVVLYRDSYIDQMYVKCLGRQFGVGTWKPAAVHGFLRAIVRDLMLDSTCTTRFYQ